MQKVGERSAHRNERSHEPEREVVAGDRLKYSGEVGAIQIEIARGIAAQVNPSENGKVLSRFENIGCIAAADGAELALANQPVSKVRAEIDTVGAEESRQFQILTASDPPSVTHC